MKNLLTLALLISFVNFSLASNLVDFTKSTDLFLKKYVSNGSVAYSKIRSNKAEIEELYTKLGSVSLVGSDSKTKKAFYINAYNVIVIYSIIQKYPVKSPMDIDGFFDNKTHLVAGENLTLNKLEKEKLLAPYKDARFHFVLVCAAKSCPPLMSAAFTPENVETQLEQRTKLTVNNNSWLKVDAKQKRIEVSKIFEWYNSDFTSKGSSILTWINIYRNTKIPVSYKTIFYEYNWALNE